MLHLERKIVITYGTFDLFHVGHVKLLRRARALGDRLVVGVSTDEFNRKKGKSSLFTYEQRVEIVASCRYVDEVFPENDWSQKPNDIERFGAQIFVMGSDWTGHFDNLTKGCEIRYLPRTQGISTTEIKNALSTTRVTTCREHDTDDRPH